MTNDDNNSTLRGVNALARRLGEELREARIRSGHTQDSLSAASGISRNVITKIETGNAARLDLRTYRALTAALEIDTLWFTKQKERGSEITQALELLFAQAEGERDVVLNQLRVRLHNNRRAVTSPLLVLIGGYAGSGKSELGKLLSQITGWPVVDKDTTARPMTEQLLLALGSDRNDRHSEIYIEQVRPLEYRCTLEAAFRNIECGHSTILTAPFLLEMNSQDWTTKLTSRCGWLGCEPIFVWVDCDIDTMRARIEHRSAARDGWKLAHWSQYCSSVDLQMRPCVSHIVINNRQDAVMSLSAQAIQLTQKISEGD